MAVEDIIQGIIANAQATSDTMSQAAVDYANQALTVAQGRTYTGTIPSIRDVELEIPPFTPEGQVLDLTAEYNRAFDEALDDFLPRFQTVVRDFMDDWFPSFDGCLKDRVDPWICATIHSGGITMPAYVERQIYDRAHERDLQESVRLRSEAFESFAAMGGYSMPSGLLYSAVQRINQDVADKAAEHSRDVAIEQNKTRLDMLKFAVQEGTKMRLGIVQALVGYINAWQHMIDSAIEKAKGVIEARARLWNAVESYYRALVAVEELGIRRDQFRAELVLKAQQIDVEAFTAAIQGATQAALSAADAVGKIAAAAQGAQNTLSGLEHSEFSSAD